MDVLKTGNSHIIHGRFSPRNFTKFSKMFLVNSYLFNAVYFWNTPWRTFVMEIKLNKTVGIVATSLKPHCWFVELPLPVGYSLKSHTSKRNPSRLPEFCTSSMFLTNSFIPISLFGFFCSENSYSIEILKLLSMACMSDL